MNTQLPPYQYQYPPYKMAAQAFHTGRNGEVPQTMIASIAEGLEHVSQGLDQSQWVRNPHLSHDFSTTIAQTEKSAANAVLTPTYFNRGFNEQMALTLNGLVQAVKAIGQQQRLFDEPSYTQAQANIRANSKQQRPS